MNSCIGLRPQHILADSRNGVAAVEFAVCLPVLVLIVFGMIEASNAIYLKHALTIGAYEVARSVSEPGGLESDAETRFNEVMSARGIENATFTINPSIDSTVLPGTPISVTVQAPANSNSIGPQWYYRDATLSATIGMVRN
jgi:TadE-like protein